MQLYVNVEGKLNKVFSASISDDKFTGVCYTTENNEYNSLSDSNGDLQGKIVIKDSKAEMLKEKLEQLLQDETDLLDDWAHGVAQENTWDLWNKSKKQYDNQTAKLEGIEAALNLVKRTLGYKD